MLGACACQGHPGMPWAGGCGAGWAGCCGRLLRPTRSFLLSASLALGCDFAAPNSLLVLNLPSALPHQDVGLEKWDVKGLVPDSLP